MTFILTVIIFTLFTLACSDEPPPTPFERPRPQAEESKSIEAPPESGDALPKPLEPSEAEEENEKGEDEAEEPNRLQQAIQQWQSWAPRCEGWSSKENCDDGDATLFSGLLCAAGSPEGCAAVAAAQGPDGRFWRSPRRVNRDLENSFSRDMAMGVLLYLQTRKDRAAATRWLTYINQHTTCQLGSASNCALRVYKLCTDDTDGRCIVTPAIWGMAGRVWQQLSLPLHSEMTRWQSYAEDRYLSEAESVPLGYALHLKAVTALLYQRLGLGLSFEQALTQSLVKRQAQNIFFRYLAGEAPDQLRDSLLRTCPLDAPARKYQWSWERDTAESAWLDSMGWDCIFLASLTLMQ